MKKGQRSEVGPVFVPLKYERDYAAAGIGGHQRSGSEVRGQK
jgi:hypothetical protein